MKCNRAVRLFPILLYLLLVTFFVMFPTSSSSQAIGNSQLYMPILARPLPDEWIKHYIANDDGTIYDFVVNNNDESLLVGSVEGVGGTDYDGIILRVQRNGQPLWQKGYGGNNNDYLHKVASANDGGYWVTGFLGISSQVIDPWVLRLDSDGHILWQKTYVPTTPSTYGHLIQDITATLDGGAIITIKGAYNGVWVIKIASNGTVNWAWFWGDAYASRSLTRVLETPDGAYILAGTASRGDENRVWVIKVNSDGTVAWQRMVGLWQATETIFNIFGLEPMSDGSYVVGITASFHLGQYMQSLWFLRFNSNGDFFWQKMFDAGENSAARMTTTTDNSVFVTVAGQPPEGGPNLRPWIFKFNSNGVLTWQYFYRGNQNYAGSSIGNAVSTTSTGDLLIAGREIYQSHFQESMLLMRLTDQGTIPGCTLLENITIPSFALYAFVETSNDIRQEASITVTDATGTSWNMGVQTEAICVSSSAAATTCLEP